MLRCFAGWIGGCLFTTAFLNFGAFAVYSAAIGGSSVSEKDGRLFVDNHGRYTEVTERQAAWVQRHYRAVQITHALGAMVGVPLILYAVWGRKPARQAELGAAADGGA